MSERVVMQSQLATAWRAGDGDAVSRIGMALGLDLTLPELLALEPAMVGLDVVSRTRCQACVVVALCDAVTTGLGTEKKRCGRSTDYFYCLAVRIGGDIVVGLKLVRTAQTLSKVWPELGTWSRVPARNLEAARRWARADGDGRARFRLVARETVAPARDPAALLAVLAEHPENRDVRDVLGDLWAELGDPRGEMIALERELESNPARADELRERIEERAHTHAATIQAEIAAHATHVTKCDASSWHVDGVTMSAARFRDHGEALFRAHPIEWLRVQPCNQAALRTLAATPHLELVRGLEMWSREPLAALRSRSLPRLRKLEVSGSTQELAPEVAPHLAWLKMIGGVITPLALDTLIRSWSPTLEYLHVYCDPSDREDASLPDLAWPHLRDLRIDAWFASDVWTAAVMCRAPRLTNVSVNASSMEEITRAAAACPDLRSLACDATPSPVAFAALLAMPALRKLYLFGVHGDSVDAMLETIANLPAGHPLVRGRIGAHEFDRGIRNVGVANPR